MKTWHSQTNTLHISPQVALVVKSLPASAGDAKDTGWEDPPGGGHGNPLQYSCLENPMDRSLVGYSS